jgi:hypothetical protein
MLYHYPTEVMAVLVWSPGPGGPPHPAPWSGAPQLVPSWWAPVALRYKRIDGGQRHVTRGSPPPPPHRHCNPSRSRLSAVAVGSSIAGQCSRLRLDHREHLHRTLGHRQHQRRPTMAGNSASRATQGHEGITPCPSPLHLSVAWIVLVPLEFFQPNRAVADPQGLTGRACHLKHPKQREKTKQYKTFKIDLIIS